MIKINLVSAFQPARPQSVPVICVRGNGASAALVSGSNICAALSNRRRIVSLLPCGHTRFNKQNLNNPAREKTMKASISKKHQFVEAVKLMAPGNEFMPGSPGWSAKKTFRRSPASPPSNWRPRSKRCAKAGASAGRSNPVTRRERSRIPPLSGVIT